MRKLKTISLLLLIVAVMMAISACAFSPAPDLSTAISRLQHEGHSRPGGGTIIINQFADDLNEERVAGVLELSLLSNLAEYEIYRRQSIDYGIFVLITDQEVIDIINEAIDGDEYAIAGFAEIVEYFEHIARLLNQYNGRYLIRVFSPDVETLLFRLFHSQAIVEIIEWSR